MLAGRIRAALLRLIGRPESAGARGEREAAQWLAARGYRIIGRNIRMGMGELDIVAHAPDGRTIVAVEVKARVRRAGAPRASTSVAPEASVTARKRAKLLRLMDALAAANQWHDRPRRIDIVAVEFHEGGRAEIRHFENAVRSSRSRR